MTELFIQACNDGVNREEALGLAIQLFYQAMFDLCLLVFLMFSFLCQTSDVAPLFSLF